MHRHAARRKGDRQHGARHGLPQHGARRFAQVAGARGAKALPAVLFIGEGKPRPREGQLFQQAADDGGLGALLFEEFFARRRVVKQILHRNIGADGAAAGRGRDKLSPLHHHLEALVAARLAGAQRHPGDGGHRGKGFAAKAKRGHGGEVALAAQLGGGVASEAGDGVVRGHAAAVVGDAHQARAARFDFHRDAGGAGVDGVFQELLDHRGRTLHDFAGGNQVCHLRRQGLNALHAALLSNIKSKGGWLPQKRGQGSSAAGGTCRPEGAAEHMFAQNGLAGPPETPQKRARAGRARRLLRQTGTRGRPAACFGGLIARAAGLPPSAAPTAS